jgi:hypothetical protein
MHIIHIKEAYTLPFSCQVVHRYADKSVCTTSISTTALLLKWYGYCIPYLFPSPLPPPPRRGTYLLNNLQGSHFAPRNDKTRNFPIFQSCNLLIRLPKGNEWNEFQSAKSAVQKNTSHTPNATAPKARTEGTSHL